nr:DUF1508 domain-containing protein [Tsuneonella troitsensis]
MPGEMELYKDRAGEFRARFKHDGQVLFSTEGYSSKAGAEHAIQALIDNANSASRVDTSGEFDPEKIQRAVDSANWTGLGKAISAQKSAVIRLRANELLQTIIQSDGDIETRADACKRVEAALVLLEAPNVPWREVVNLLNHPAVTASLAALSLIQFILGLSN